MRYSEPRGLSEQIEALRTKWPQAHYEPPKSGSKHDWHLILLPGLLLPKGWNKTICTALFLARLHEPNPPGRRDQTSVKDGGTCTPLDGFYVDLPDLRIAKDMAIPKYARPFAMNDWKRFWHEPTKSFWDNKEEICGFPQWRELTRFWWRAQMHNPNKDTLFTAAMLIRKRLGMVL